MIVETLFSLLGMKVDEASVKKTDAVLDGFKSKLQGIALAVAPAALGAAVANLTQAVAMDADRAAKGARAIGVTTEAYQELGTAAEFAGLAQTDIDNAINKSSRAVSEAKKGNKEFQKTFRTLKLSFRELHKLAPDERFAKIAGALNKVENQADKTTLMMKLMEESGPRFASFIAGGAEGIAKAREDARSLGFIISDEDAKRAEAFNDNLGRIDLLWKGIRNTLGSDIIEAALPLLDELVTTGKELLPDLIDDMKEAGPTIKQVFEYLTDWVKAGREATKTFGGLSNVLELAGIGILALVATLAIAKGANIAWLATTIAALAPWALLAVGIAVVIGALRDLHGWMNGKDSLIGRIVGPYDPQIWSEISSGLQIVGAAVPIASVIALGGEIMNLEKNWDDYDEKAKGVFMAQREYATAAWTSIGEGAEELGEGLYDVLVFGPRRAFVWIREAFVELLAGLRREMGEFIEPLAALKDGVSGSLGSASNRVRGLIERNISAPLHEGERQVLARLNSGPKLTQRIGQIVVNANGLNEEQAQRAVTNGVHDAQKRQLGQLTLGRAR